MEQVDYNAMSEVDLGKHYIEKIKESIRLELQTTELNKQLTAINSILYKKMDAKELKMFVVDELKFEADTKENFSLEEGTLPWNEPTGEFYKWLKEIGEEKLIKTKMDVQAGTRDAFLKDLLKKGMNLPEFIKRSFFSRVKFNKAQVKRMVESEI